MTKDNASKELAGQCGSDHLGDMMRVAIEGNPKVYASLLQEVGKLARIRVKNLLRQIG